MDSERDGSEGTDWVSGGGEDIPGSARARARARDSQPPPGEGEPYVAYMDIDAIQFALRNPKQHDEKGLERSFYRFGFNELPFLNETTQRLVAGHGRIEKLRDLRARKKAPPKRIRVTADGRWEAPVIRGVGFATDEDAELYLLASNKLTENGGNNADMVKEILSEYDKPDLLTAGYDSSEVDKILGQYAGGGGDGEGDGDTAPKLGGGLTYKVIVQVKDERDQEMLMGHLEKQGYQCTPLIS